MDTSIYSDMSSRTGGDIYIGVVGPVRSGKSTFIKRFMDTLVIPNIESEYTRERAKDELPQSAAGRTISFRGLEIRAEAETTYGVLQLVWIHNTTAGEPVTVNIDNCTLENCGEGGTYRHAVSME